MSNVLRQRICLWFQLQVARGGLERNVYACSSVRHIFDFLSLKGVLCEDFYQGYVLAFLFPKPPLPAGLSICAGHRPQNCPGTEKLLTTTQILYTCRTVYTPTVCLQTLKWKKLDTVAKVALAQFRDRLCYNDPTFPFSISCATPWHSTKEALLQDEDVTSRRPLNTSTADTKRRLWRNLSKLRKNFKKTPPEPPRS